MLRIINAALSGELFFAIADRNLIIVEIDATYSKPFTARAIMFALGQNINALLNANQIPKSSSSGLFAMSARPYRTSIFPFDNSTTVGFLRYKMNMTQKSKPLYVHYSESDLSVQNHNLPEMDFSPNSLEISEALHILNSLVMYLKRLTSKW